MRDKSRIEPLLNKIKAFWLDNSQLRFGQIIYMLAEHVNHPDIFFPEEKEWNKAIDTLISRNCEARYKVCKCSKSDEFDDRHGCSSCKHSDNEEYELPCAACRGTEILALNGYKNNCYYEEYKFIK